MGRILKTDFWFYFLGVLTIGIILFLWFRLFLVRYFDADELAHLHWAWLMYKGEKPFLDFFYVLPPFFNFLFYPLFWIFGESISTVVFARVISFFVYLLMAGAVYLLASEVFQKKTGLLAVIVFLSLPMGLTKQMEIRPDNLTVAFFVLSLWAFFRGLFSPPSPASWRASAGRENWFFWAGLFLGLNAVIIQKGVLNVGLSLLVMIFWTGILKRKEFVGIIKPIFLGLLVPFLMLVVYLWGRGVLVEGLEAIVRLAPLTNVGIPTTPFNRFFWPNDVYYGGYKNFSWYFNKVLFWMAGVAIVWGLVKGFKKKKLEKETVEILSFGFLAGGLVWGISKTISPFLQYFLPIFPLVAILVAGGGWWFLKLFEKKRLVFLVFWAIFLGVCLKSCDEAQKYRRWWTADPNLKYINNYLGVSGPEDRVFDFWGFYVFRRDGYFVCCNHFPRFTEKLRERLPDFVEWMKKSQNKFITFEGKDEGLIGGRMALLSAPELRFLTENYVPSGVNKVLVVGRTFNFGKTFVERVEIFAEGDYKVSGGDLVVDGREHKVGERIFLGKGIHEFRGRGKVSIKYEVIRNK